MPDGRTMAEMSRIRVAAYVLRRRDVWQLLVFEQAASPEAGVQIPAGGVQPNEALPDAVLREVSEETGLVNLIVRNRLHVDSKPNHATGTPCTTTYFVVDAPPDTPDAWTHSVYGRGADTGMTFHCRFEPLPLPHPLADDQDAGLALLDPDFTTLTRR